jgi:hypothetical protein
MKGLNDLRDDALRIAVEHGFKDATIAEDFALMHSEISEALEDHRDGRGVTEVWYEEKVPAFDALGGLLGDVVMRRFQGRIGITSPPVGFTGLKPAGIPHEMADVVIRVLHFCGKHKIDLEKAVAAKMAYNEGRPFKHGKVM